MDFNPHLTAAAGNKGGPASIERPHEVKNIAWQTRPAVPSAAEAALAQALETIFGDGVYELPQIVARLNAAKVAAPSGITVWTEDSFRAELARLAT